VVTADPAGPGEEWGAAVLGSRNYLRGSEESEDLRAERSCRWWG
jgi:hypothetical protein